MQDLVIYGSGGHAREVLQIVLDLNAERERWNLVGFLDDDSAKHGASVHGFPVLGDAAWLREHPETYVSIAIGDAAARRRIDLRLREQQPTRFATLIHPRAWVGRMIEADEGCTICAGAVVTTDVRLGRLVILNIGCTVSHDAVLGDYVTAAPGATISGNATIGDGCDLGAGCTVIQGTEIGAWTIVGAGATVVRSLPPNVTAVGVPARPIKERPAGWHE